VTGKLSEKLLQKLHSRFADRGLIVYDGKRPVALFPAIHDDVGDIQIWDDDHELTVYVGSLHGHFPNYNDKLTLDAREERMVDDVLAFLEDVFAERIEFWAEGDRMGGWHERGKTNPFGRRNAQRYVWSGPLNEPS
jgi:hypothetical protein